MDNKQIEVEALIYRRLQAGAASIAELLELIRNHDIALSPLLVQQALWRMVEERIANFNLNLLELVPEGDL